MLAYRIFIFNECIGFVGVLSSSHVIWFDASSGTKETWLEPESMLVGMGEWKVWNKRMNDAKTKTDRLLNK